MKIKLEQISLQQFILLFIFFEIGTSIVIAIATEAKQDAWIAVIIATVVGLVLMCIYYKSFKLKQGTLYELLSHSFGRHLSKLLKYAYIVYFLYCSCRVLRDFNELLVSAVLPNTPIEFTSFLFMAVVVYIIYFGLEVFSRTTTIFAPYMFLFLATITLFLWVNGSIDLSHLKPVLADGMGPVYRSLFPELLTFPFGELIVFTVIFPQVKNISKSIKPLLLAILISGIIILFYLILNISVIGPTSYARTTFPLLSTAREISIANFLERLDALVVFIVMLGVFVKVSIYFYCALKGLESIYKLPYRYFAFPMGMLTATFSVVIAYSFNEHIIEGLEIVPLYLHIPFQYILPFLVFIILLIKSKKGATSNLEKKNYNT
ncbi:GerAB/ArcD/ProY family transporter [Sutcliffiella halmapala]|uniref:GerAB/ArcD/ProY family transporter n=1 Tax=Sutcliffiella halmapala TaxID=79882 RepID=UPI000994F3DB|nr:endospore germination permease [Sutcliffiella halmapala]